MWEVNKLEELLNKLIDMGWKAFGETECKHIRTTEDENRILLLSYLPDEKPEESQFTWCIDEYSLNDLCSIDSWLRQFVVEKGLTPLISNNQIRLDTDRIENERDYYEEEYQYRLMLSSIQESKEKFILDNIKLDG